MIDDDLRSLDLPPDVTVDQLKAVWKRTARKHHPDHGGDPELFCQAKEAYERVLVYLTTPVKCSACKGTGKKAVSRSFYSVKLPCKVCNGRGMIKRGE